MDTLYPRILERFRSRIRERRYVITLHALDELDEDALSVFDVERAILTGEIVERQRDQTTRERKYLVRGRAVDGRQIVVVSKLGATDKLIVITAWLMMNKLKCDNCGEQKARIRQISRSYGSGKDLLVIEGIPLISCSNCGESYFTVETLHEIERIKLHREGFAKTRRVPVAKFHQVA